MLSPEELVGQLQATTNKDNNLFINWLEAHYDLHHVSY